MVTTIGGVLEPNARITIEVLNRVGSRDTATNNPTISTIAYQVSAYIHLDRPPPKDIERPQPGNQSAIWAEGRVLQVISLANPTLDLPPVMPQGKYAGVMGEVLRSPDRWMKAKFWMTPRISSGAIIQYDCFKHVGEKLWGCVVLEGVQ